MDHGEYVPGNENKTHDLVMRMTSDIQMTGRNLTADRFFSSVETAEALYSRNTTFIGTIMPHRKGLPQEVKQPVKERVKGKDPRSSEFFWKEGNPCMLVIYQPNLKKEVLLLTAAHNKPDISEDWHKKPVCIEMYNITRCGVDICNKMAKEYTALSKTDDWRFVVFCLCLDIAGINAQTIKYNLGKDVMTRRELLKTVGRQLTTSWMKERRKILFYRT